MIDLLSALDRARATGRIPDGVLDWARSTGDVATVAAAHVLHGLADGIALRTTESIEHCDRAIEIYLGLPLTDQPPATIELHQGFLWSAYTTRAIVMDDEGRLQESVEGHRTALALALELDYGRGVVVSRTNLAFELMRVGESTEAAFQLFHDSPDRYPDWHLSHNLLVNQHLAILYYRGGTREKALERARTCLEIPGAAEYHDNLRAMGQLAGLAASVGTIAEAEAVLTQIAENPAAETTPRVRLTVETARATILARQGRVDDALNLLDRLNLDELPPGTYEDMVYPGIVRMEVLLFGNRFRDALSLADRGRSSPTSRWNRGRLRELEADALAGLGRWEEALVALREAHETQRAYHIDPDHYTRLAFPQGLDHAGSGQASIIADLYARQVRLRDILAHDIRGLFNSVLLAYESLLLVRDGEMRRSRLQRLIGVIDALGDVPERMNAYLQLVDGTGDAKLEPVDPAQVIDEVVARYAPQADHRSVELRVEVGPEVAVMADIDMLRASLYNLMSNALKFTPAGSLVKIGWTMAEGKREAAVAREVEIFVADQGPGLTAEEQQRILRPSPSPTDPGGLGLGGSGLGLQIVTGFVDRMHGQLAVTSVISGGSRFAVVLNLANRRVGGRGESVGGRSPAPTYGLDGSDSSSSVYGRATGGKPSPKADLTTFVVDDDPLSVDMIAELLRSAGADVVTATNRSDALRLLRSTAQFDLIFLDVMMDGVPVGIELAKRSRSLRSSAPVVVITGLGPSFDDPALADCLILRKPVHFETVRAVIEQFRATGVVTRSSAIEVDRVEATRVDGSVEAMAGGRPAQVSDADPLVVTEGLMIASVQAASRHENSLSLELAAEAETIMERSGVEPSVELVWQLRHNVGLVYRNQGRLEEARDHLEQLLQFAVEADYRYGLPRTALNLAMTYSQMGRSEEGIMTLAWATNLIGTDQMARAHLFNALGRMLLDNGVVELAVQQLRRALSNYSAVAVEPILDTLRWLAEAYFETGDYASATAVLSRMQRLHTRIVPTETDLAVARSIEAALVAESGDREMALHLVRSALAAVPAEGRGAIASIAVTTEVRILSALGRHRELVDRWAELGRIPGADSSVSNLTRLSAALTAVGDYREAYRVEQRAAAAARERSIGLPTLVALTRDLAGSSPADGGPTEGIAPVDDAATLGRRTGSLIDRIAALKTAAVALLSMSDDTDVDFDLSDLDERLRAVEQAVVTFDADTEDPLVVSGCR